MDDPPLIDGTRLGRMVAAQFPEWAGLPLKPVESAGTDNLIFRLGRDLAARLPRRPEATGQAEREHKWLPGLAPHLPIAVPTPLRIGQPAEDYPWIWSICRWLPGRDAAAAPISDLSREAVRLGRFLAALHGINPEGGPAAGAENHWRGAPLKLLDARLRRDLDRVAGQFDAKKVLTVWDEARSADPCVHGVWVHGDIHVGNLLVDEGRISAVLDFGLTGRG